MKKLTVIGLIFYFGLNGYSQRYETEFNWDTIDFENDYDYLKIDTSTNNSWQIGHPNKNYMGSAYSGEKAIITDTSFFYVSNNHSYFDLFIGDFNIDWYPEDIFIEFKHKFDTDTLKDGGYITVSYDNGTTWMNIIQDSAYWDVKPQWENKNLYTLRDTLYNGTPGFSGHSDGWVSTWFTWHYIPCGFKNSNIEIGDTMILRFNFISDSTNSNKEGWLIDDIRLYSVDLGSTIKSVNVTNNISIYPNPTTGISTIDLGDFYNDISLNIIDLTGEVISTKHLEYSKRVLLNSHNFQSGIYIVQLILDNKYSGIKRWIVN